jgi:hypothetical protein
MAQSSAESGTEKSPEDYMFHISYCLIDDYKEVENKEDWLSCSVCKQKPKVWTFDNGRFASCMCHNSKYDNFTIRAESIMSVISRCNGSAIEYDSDELRKNWNHYFIYRERLFPTNTKNIDRW